MMTRLKKEMEGLTKGGNWYIIFIIFAKLNFIKYFSLFYFFIKIKTILILIIHLKKLIHKIGDSYKHIKTSIWVFYLYDFQIMILTLFSFMHKQENYSWTFYASVTCACAVSPAFFSSWAFVISADHYFGRFLNSSSFIFCHCG